MFFTIRERLASEIYSLWAKNFRQILLVLEQPKRMAIMRPMLRFVWLSCSSKRLQLWQKSLAYLNAFDGFKDRFALRH